VLGFGFGLKARKKLCSTSTVGADSLGHDPNIAAGSLSIHEKKGSTIVRGERGRPVLLFLEAEFREPELGGNRADEHNCLSGTICSTPFIGLLEPPKQPRRRGFPCLLGHL
jgi:hypothetical protein